MSLCKKDSLAKLHRTFSDDFDHVDFVPETFSVPSEKEKAVEMMVKSEPDLWIRKPCNRSGYNPHGSRD